jgi:hypothetical protein
MANLLCDTCKEVLRPTELDLPPNKPFTLLETWTHIPEYGALEGCPFCSFISSMLSEEDISVLRQHMEINSDQDLPQNMKYSTTYKVQTDSRKCLWIIFHHKGSLDQNGEKILRHVALVPDGQYFLALIFEFPLMTDLDHSVDVDISGSPAPKGFWDLTKYWLRDCNTQHLECKRSLGSDARLPSRLLHVGRAGTTSIRLCEQAPPFSEYVSLSHCVGIPDLTFPSRICVFGTRRPFFYLSRMNSNSQLLTINHLVGSQTQAAQSPQIKHRELSKRNTNCRTAKNVSTSCRGRS